MAVVVRATLVTGKPQIETRHDKADRIDVVAGMLRCMAGSEFVAIYSNWNSAEVVAE